MSLKPLNFVRSLLCKTPVWRMLGTMVLPVSTRHQRALATLAASKLENAEVSAEKTALGVRAKALENDLEQSSTKVASSDAALDKLQAAVRTLERELSESQTALQGTEATLRDALRREEVALEQVWAYRTIARAPKRSHSLDAAAAKPSDNASAGVISALRQRITDLETCLRLGSRTNPTA